MMTQGWCESDGNITYFYSYDFNLPRLTQRTKRVMTCNDGNELKVFTSRVCYANHGSYNIEK